jgi:hypothetical protein
MGGRHFSAYYNLFAHCKSRTPRFDGNRNLGTDIEFADFRNNVIYNWGNNNVYGGEGGHYNIIANYYKPGPSTARSAVNKMANPFKKGNEIPFGKWFIDENVNAASEEISRDNWKGVELDKGTTADLITVKAANAFPAMKHEHLSALAAYEKVLNEAGASFKRDTLDIRIINDVRSGKGRFIDVQGGFPHGTEYQKTIHAWPALDPGSSLEDQDRDGIPDAWERAKNLDPRNAADAMKNDLHVHYNNLEVYLNERAAGQKNY